MLAKINVPASDEVGRVAATTGAAREGDEDEGDLDSGALFHMSHTQAGMTAYKNATAGTTVEVADGTILTVNGLGTIEVDLNQPVTTTKLVKMVAIAYVPERLRNLLSTRKTLEQWGKPLVYYKTKSVLGFPGEESLVFNFCPRKGSPSATGVRQTPTQGTALAFGSKNG